MIRLNQHPHFVGIGGAGMSPLAQLLVARGHPVSGCDLRESEATRQLRAQGAVVSLGHDPAHLEGVDVVIASRAVPEETPELQEARRRGVPVRHRAELLGQVMSHARGIAVVGTHGKTTTTAMTTLVLLRGGFDPTALVGAEVHDFEGNVTVGRSEWMVAEVDESDGSLVHVAPWAAVVTSLDLTDHADFYTSSEHLEDTFRRFLEGVHRDGVAVLCVDHPAVARLADAVAGSIVTYGLHEGALTAEILGMDGSRIRAGVHREGRRIGDLELRVPGRYNVANALAATSVGLYLGVPFPRIAEALAGFRGVARRFEVRGEVGGILVVDDYAHNPVKVAAVLRAARESWPGRRITVIFQPHRFTRTKTTHGRFAHAFDDADEVYITDIYPADERPIPDVTAALIVDAVQTVRPVHYVPTWEAAAQEVADRSRPRDLVLTLGAGDVGGAATALLRNLEVRAGP